jgi:hypothetical protein
VEHRNPGGYQRILSVMEIAARILHVLYRLSGDSRRHGQSYGVVIGETCQGLNCL